MTMNLNELRSMPDDVAFEVDGVHHSKASLMSRMEGEIANVRMAVIAQRDEWVMHRAQSGVEDRWRRANELYYGKDLVETSFIETLKTGPTPVAKQGAQAARSRVTINIVRPKVDQAVARMCEILLPTDDKNWGIRPTPVPDHIQEMVGDDRQTVMPGTQTPTPEGLTADQEAQAYMTACRKKVEKMEKTIDDQLTECHYNAEQRQMISDGVRLGCGIMLGPFPATQTSKVWASQKGKQALTFSSKTVPSSIHSDPWDVWFDPAAGKHHQNGAGFWHRRTVTRKQIRLLRDVMGFDAEELRKVLTEAPGRVTVAEGRVRKTNAIREQAYELWTYHGEMEPDHMTLMSSATNDPLLDVDFGVVMLINDHVVGTMPSWIADKSLPVDVWCWREGDDMPQGYGLPDELESQQRVVTSAWRQVMDNGRYSAGSQIVFMDGVEPIDGKREIYPGKLWKASSEKISDARAAMAAIDFPSHLGEMLQVVDKAMQFADSETGMPQLIGGEQGSAPETVGGTVMLYNNAQAVLRMRVKLYDDDVTQPHINRYYDWNMANNSDESIKGDAEIDARGSTALLEKDIQNQATLNLANITSNPRYAPYLDPKAELETILKAFKVQPDAIMASEDQIKKNLAAPPPQDPRLQAAQMTLQAKQLDTQDRQQQRQAEQQTTATEREDRQAERQYNMQREQGEYQIAMTHEQNARDMQQEKIASTERITAAQLETNTGIKHLEIDTKRQLFNAEVAVKQRDGSGI